MKNKNKQKRGKAVWLHRKLCYTWVEAVVFVNGLRLPHRRLLSKDHRCPLKFSLNRTVHEWTSITRLQTNELFANGVNVATVPTVTFVPCLSRAQTGYQQSHSWTGRRSGTLFSPTRSSMNHLSAPEGLPFRYRFFYSSLTQNTESFQDKSFNCWQVHVFPGYEMVNPWLLQRHQISPWRHQISPWWFI